ncbi:MAG: protein kinase [Acidobacteria bacterium]|nr:protein kinase [Acidobacteriota bacterium]
MKVCSFCGKQWSDNTKFCPADGNTVLDIVPRDNSIRPSFRNKEKEKKLEKIDPWTNLIGKTLNRTYQIEEKLGQGGMGAVFRARHLGIGDTIALKVISEEHTKDSVMLARFRREAQAVRRLAHPNAVTVHDFNTTEEGLYFMVMEFVKGQTLEQYLSEQQTSLSPQRALEILRPVANALDVAHNLGIIHRDIKPANLMLCKDSSGREQVKVLDFGTARLSSTNDPEAVSLTHQGQIFGTPFYMAPESVLGEPITHSIDIYSLGIILYKMLTGTLPFQSDKSMQVMMSHAHTTPDIPSVRNPKLHTKYDSLILKAIEKTAAKRYQSAGEFISTLASLVNEDNKSVASTIVEEEYSVVSNIVSKVKLAAIKEPEFNCYIGRENELKRLQEIFSQACESRANPVFVIGSPGLGKTQLLTRFRDWANEQGSLVLMGKFFDYGGTVTEPLRVFKNLLMGLISTGILNSIPVSVFSSSKPTDDKTGVSETSSSEKWQAFANLANSFISLARNRTVVLILDDIQWADVLSLEFIRYLLRNVESLRFCFVAGSHTEESKTKGHPFREWLVKQAQYNHYEKIELQAFDKQGIKTLLETIFHFIEVSQKDIEVLYKLTSGNPLYLIEVIRLLVDNQRISFQDGVWCGGDFDEVKLPDTVTNIVRYKMEACSEELREVLIAASVIGDTFEFDLLKAICEISEGDLESFLAMGVKELLLKDEDSTEDYYEFYNSTIRRAIYDDIPKRHKKRLHFKAAKEIVKLNVGKSHLTNSALAYHFYSAGEWELAAKHSLASVEQAFSKQAMDEVIRFSRYAEDALTRLAAEDALASESEESEADINEFRRRIAQVRIKRSIALMRLGNFKEAQQEAESLQQYIENLTPELQARLYLVLTELCFWSSRNAEGVNIGSRGLVLARQANDEECIRYTMFFLAWCRVRITPISESTALFQQIIDLAKEAEDRSLEARALSALANLIHITGQWRKARTYLEEAYKIAKEVGDHFVKSQVLLFSAWTVEFENNYEKLKQYSDEGIKVAHTYGWRNWEGYQYYVIGRSYLRRLHSDFILAEEMLSRSLSIMKETHDLVGQLVVSKELLKLELLTEPQAKLSERIREVINGFNKNQEMISNCEAMLTLADLESQLGNDEGALVFYLNALKISELVPFLEIQWRIHFSLAKCLKKQNNEPGAIEHMIRAIEVINRLKQEFDTTEEVAAFLENKEEVYSAYADMFS